MTNSFSQKIVSIMFSTSQYHLLVECILLAMSLVLGFVVSLSYIFSCKKEEASCSLACTLVVLPLGIATTVYLISSNLIYGVTLAGLFLLVRFRSFLATSKEILYLLCSLCVGLGTGLGAGFRVLFGIFFCLVLCFLDFAIMYKMAKDPYKNKVRLEVCIYQSPPCNASYLFKDIFEKYLTSWELESTNNKENHKILTYWLCAKESLGFSFIEEMRQKNSNLPIELCYVLPKRQVL